MQLIKLDVEIKATFVSYRYVGKHLATVGKLKQTTQQLGLNNNQTSKQLAS